MNIARERYLDDSSERLFSLALSSRTVAAHSLLTALTPDDRQVIAEAIGQAFDDIIAVLRQRLSESPR